MRKEITGNISRMPVTTTMACSSLNSFGAIEMDVYKVKFKSV